MGRHSAGDDDDVADVTSTQIGGLNLGTRPARHASPDDVDSGQDSGQDEQITQMIAVIDPAAEVDDRHDTDVFPEVPPDVVPEMVPELPPGVGLGLGSTAGPQAEAPAGIKPSRAERRARKKAEKAAQQAREEAERQALKQADDLAAAAEAPPAEAPPAAVEAQPAEPVPAVETKPGKKQKAAKADRSESDTQADLRLLRQNSAVRARCVAAVLVSFLLYTLVVLVIGRTDVYLLWIWIPIVVSGVGVGALLDLAHRAASGDGGPAKP